MLTDRERQAWREIERRLAGDSDVKWTARAVGRRGPGDHLRPVQHGPALASLALAILLLVGPNLLTDDQVADRRRPPPPKGSERGPVGPITLHI